MSFLDICVITAPYPRQADDFRSLIDLRRRRGLYPREIDFRVYSDPQSGRVGSGGGTLWALLNLLEDLHVTDPAAFFQTHRIAIIHAGGESRRMPCFVPEGKIFAPVPVASSSIIPPVVLDLQLSLFLKYPWRHNGEVVITSGDVVVDFDTALVPDDRGEVCGFTKPASFEQGSRHGVFKFDANHKQVVDFFQKAAPEFLSHNAALEGTGACALDMGIVALNPDAAEAFIRLSRTKIRGASMRDHLRRGGLAFDLYLEVMTACLRDLSWPQYRQRINRRSTLNDAAAKAVFEAFHPFALSGVITQGTTFLHFGALPELHQACLEVNGRGLKLFYSQENEEILPQCTPELIQYNSHGFDVALSRHMRIIAESSRDCRLQNLSGSNLFAGLTDWSSSFVIPEGICIDQRHIRADTITLVYGMNDTFKPERDPHRMTFCGMAMDDWRRQHGLTPADLWGNGPTDDLLTAKLFCATTDHTFISGYWQKPYSDAWLKTFRKAKRFSIREVNEADSLVARDRRRMELRTTALRERLFAGTGWKYISRQDFADVAAGRVPELRRIHRSADDSLLAAYRNALVSSISGKGNAAVDRIQFEIDYVRRSSGTAHPVPSVKEDQIVWARSPVRFDLAGGWSDTPPYTLRFGGQVVNCAVDLNGQPPIQVFCRKIASRHIRIHSIDLGITETINEFSHLGDYRDPSSPFGLPKAALCLTGFTEENFRGSSLEKALARMGCGVEITLLCAVPKGSGLGTSSILAATILGALHRFFGLHHSREDLFLQVLQMEQMLTTGGGWQDQIGGATGGVKFIESRPGLRPRPVIHQLDPWLFEAPDAHARFTLFYTGMTRLAKNILQEVVHQVNCNTPAYLFTLHRIKQLAQAAQDAIGLRDFDDLAAIIARSWDANNRIHPGSTNREIGRMIRETRHHCSGVKLLGAGGGGYALFASPDRQLADALRQILVRRFENDKARIVDFSLNQTGLQVTVS